MSAWIAPVASLIGGLLGQNSEKKAIERQNAYNSPEQIRARAEKAGFNPLLFVGPGVGQQVATGGSNIMGSAIASAGLALADGMDKAKMVEIERSRLAMERQRLDILVQNATIRPKSGGIYAGNMSAPSRGGVGGYNGQVSRVSSDSVAGSLPPVASGAAGGAPALRPLATTLPVDSRRKVDNGDVKTTPGFMVIDNPAVPFPLYVPTIDGDEPLGVTDIPSVGSAFLGSYLYSQYQKSEAQPKRPSTDVYNPWLLGVPDAYNDNFGRHNPLMLNGFVGHGKNPITPKPPPAGGRVRGSVNMRDATKQLMQPRPSNYW